MCNALIYKVVVSLMPFRRCSIPNGSVRIRTLFRMFCHSVQMGAGICFPLLLYIRLQLSFVTIKRGFSLRKHANIRRKRKITPPMLNSVNAKENHQRLRRILRNAISLYTDNEKVPEQQLGFRHLRAYFLKKSCGICVMQLYV